MKMFRTLLFLFSLCAFAGLLFAHDEDHGNQSSDYQNGYARGYQHASADVQARMNFDYRDDEYQNSGSCDVRVGYLEGYADGYFRRQARFQPNSNSGYGGNPGGYSGSDVQVVAFTRTDFSGPSQQFRIGQYPHLESQMNDSIDSISVRGNVRVILFDDSNFNGKRVVLDHDFSDLGDFKSKAASMIVEFSTNR